MVTTTFGLFVFEGKGRERSCLAEGENRKEVAAAIEDRKLDCHGDMFSETAIVIGGLCSRGIDITVEEERGPFSHF
jgi:hypothetical protein